MADTGWVIAGTGANDASYGTQAWNNPGNITADDTSYADVGSWSSGSLTNYLKGTNFGFSVPAGSTIDGIEVRVTNNSVTQVNNNRVRIVKGGTIGTTDRSDNTVWTATGSDTFGSTSDLWGETWTVSDINASNFGFVIAGFRSWPFAAAHEVDFMEIRVTYTEGSAGPSAGTLALMGVGV